MTTINDQPQEKLARYADRTGAKWQYQLSKHWNTGPHWQHAARDTVKLGTKIRLVLSEYGLPSHLRPYKDNPRLPGNGYRVPTGEDSCNQPHDMWIEATGDWTNGENEICRFSNLTYNYRLPASVLPPDWDEMTREDAPAGAETSDNPTQPAQPEQKDLVVNPSQRPEIFTAHGQEWYHLKHMPKGVCHFLMKGGAILTINGLNLDPLDIIGWRPADAPAKLPRPGPHPQDDVQALKARVQELEVDYQMMQGSLLSILGELDCEEPASVLLRIKTLKEEKNACSESTKKYATELQELADLLGHRVSPFYRVKQRLEEVLKEAAASTPTLRPIAEMPAEVPEGCVRLYARATKRGNWVSQASHHLANHFLDIRLPAPPDPDAELRREFEAWMNRHDQFSKITLRFIKENGVYALREHETAFQAFKAGKTH